MAYLRIVETAEFFLLYPQDYVAYIITKQSFATGDEMVRFRDIIRANFQGKRELLE